MQNMQEKYLFIFTFGAFLFISLQLLSSSDVLTKIKLLSIKRDRGPKYNEKTLDKKWTGNNGKVDIEKQRLCLLAGPHKTGTSSVQTNMYRWSKPTISFSDSKFEQLPEPIISWIWPVPLDIARLEHEDNHTWAWTPSKVFYPMIEALVSRKRVPKRNLFQKLSVDDIIQSYRNTIGKYWEEGKNIVMGTEAMDLIVKLPEGPSMLKKLRERIMPQSIDGDQINVVVMYRTPKVKHLVSMWLQNCNRAIDDKFYEWITTTGNTLGALDSLGMVELIHNRTDWNIDLIHLGGLNDAGWDVSNYVACNILGNECVNKIPNGLNKSETVITNVRSSSRNPNVPNETLDEIDVVINQYDCNYIHLLSNPRINIHFPRPFKELKKKCEGEGVRHHTRADMKSKIVEIAKKGGKIF
jgi:hypothetical protein